MTVNNPHFDLPFRFVNGNAAVVEQDTDRDIVNCVTAIVGTIKGHRMEAADFGISDPTFQKQPIDTTAMTEEILAQEARAEVALQQTPDLIQKLTADVTVQVARREQG